MLVNAAIVVFHKDHPLDPHGANGGAETATIALARTLVSLGREVFVAAELRGADTRDGVVVDGVTYCDLGLTFNTTNILQRFQHRPIHIIVACKAQALLESRAYSNVLTRLFVTHEPSADGLGLRPGIIGAVADRVVCVSQSQKQLLVSAGCSDSKITVIPNGVDLALFTPGNNEARDYQKLIFAGALVVDKGLHLLIESFAALKPKYPRLKLDVYGTAALWGREDYFDVEHVKRSLPDVTFHGAVPPSTIAEAMRGAGLMVQPSIYFESFSLTTLEAQVSGLPVIGSALGGMREIIEHGKTGLLITPTTSQDLAQNIESLISSPEKLKEMSRNALSHIRPKYSWEKTAQQFLALLKEAGVPDAAVGDANAKEHAMSSTHHIGFVSTFNQRCGLATYAHFLISEMSKEQVTILAEDVPEGEKTAVDDTSVIRCWKRGAGNYKRLFDAILERNISLLYLNCHYRFFDYPAFLQFLTLCKEREVAVLAHIHNPYTTDETLRSLVTAVDGVVVHTPENRLEILANGGTPERTFVVEHGVRKTSYTRATARKALSFADDQRVVVCFGFVQPHKGIDEVIIAIAELRSRIKNLLLCIVGGPHAEDPHSTEYHRALKQYVTVNNLEGQVRFIEGFIDDSTVETNLTAADAVVMNYRSNYYEASGAVSLALGAGAPTICSLAPTFSRLGDAVFHITGGFPLTHALEVVLTNQTVRDTLRANAAAWTQANSWKESAARVIALVNSYPRKTPSVQSPRSESAPPKRTTSARPLKILMMNRHTAFTHRGGDTVVMEKVSAGLRSLDATVDIDVQGIKDPTNYDIVHLHNFATPEITEAQAKVVVDRKKPFVVTAMYEDLPRFYHQMIAHYRAFRAYVEGGQNRALWPELLNQAKNVTPCERWENTWTANQAAALIATGSNEKLALLRDYPNTRSIELYRTGSDVSEADVSPTAFAEKYGISEYVLCVGRLETRKNQLALLKALEDSEIPLVLATTGFTYQPEYEAACRAFRRKGRTLFLEHLSAADLWAAYRGARVHALPSWYELPGMVSIEAARANTPTVVTDYGTVKDYLGERAYYCDPGDPETIYSAIMTAYYGPRDSTLSQQVAACTWAHAAETIRSIYERAMETPNKTARSAYSLPEWENRSPDQMIAKSLEAVTERTSEATSKVAQIAEQAEILPASAERIRATKLCEEADSLLRSGQCDAAVACFQEAARIMSDCGRAHRGLGVIALRSEKFGEAEGHFRDSLRIQANDGKALAGLASCKWSSGDRGMAFEMYCEAFRYDPSHSGVLLHIINAGYTLGRLQDLRDCLLEYLSQRPEDHKIRYCLAGCYYKREEFELSLQQIKQVLLNHPDHSESLELKGILETKLGETPRAGIIRSFDSQADATLRELEVLKEEKKFAELAQTADTLLKDSALTEDQRAHTRVLRAEAWIMTGRTEEAEQELSVLSVGNAWVSRAISGRGVIAASREAWETARELFDDALEKNPENDVALAGLGVVSMKLGKLQLAWDYFSRALRVNGENLRALTGLVQVGYPLQRHRDLESALRGYLEIHPANLSILYSYAGCLYSQKRVSEAKLELEKIVLFDPNHGLDKELLDKIDSDAGTDRAIGI